MDGIATSGALRRNALGVAHIVFFVVAAAAPLAVVVGVTPYAFSAGNGTGVPLTFLIVGAMYLLFSVGFIAMGGHIGRAVSFYPYIARGLGRQLGVGGALISIVSYFAVEMMALSLFGIFASSIAGQASGTATPWWSWAVALNAIVYLCGIRNVEFSGRMLGALMIGEVLILSALGVSILGHHGGPEGITLAPFGPAALFSGNLSLALVFIVSAFIGFEATSIFGEEARNPERSIPAATYIAVVLIALFYAFSTWVIALDYGPANVARAADADPTHLYQLSMERHLGSLAGAVLQLLMLTSTFACVLSFHNTINRYVFVVARERVLHNWLARTHAEHDSPQAAGLAQAAIVMVLALAFPLAGLAPELAVGLCSAFAAIGILVIQLLVSIAVIAFFWTDNRQVSAWRRCVAPAVSTVALSTCLYLMSANLATVSGSESPIVKAYPAFIAAVGIVGILIARRMKAAHPEAYGNIGRAST
jgi:amino acid transporter